MFSFLDNFLLLREFFPFFFFPSTRSRFSIEGAAHSTPPLPPGAGPNFGDPQVLFFFSSFDIPEHISLLYNRVHLLFTHLHQHWCLPPTDSASLLTVLPPLFFIRFLAHPPGCLWEVDIYFLCLLPTVCQALPPPFTARNTSVSTVCSPLGLLVPTFTT